MGTPVSDTTEIYQYQYAVSCGFATICFKTQYFLPTAANGYLQFAHRKYSLITLLFGWWCFPWGPLEAISALLRNLDGGNKRTVSSLIQLIEWGWDAPVDASATAHRKKIIELTPLAAQEIQTKIKRGRLFRTNWRKNRTNKMG